MSVSSSVQELLIAQTKAERKVAEAREIIPKLAQSLDNERKEQLALLKDQNTTNLAAYQEKLQVELKAETARLDKECELEISTIESAGGSNISEIVDALYAVIVPPKK